MGSKWLSVDDIRQLKHDGKHDEVEEMLLWCIDFAEGDSRAYQYEPPRSYYRDLAIVYRKDDRHQNEVDILERYTSRCAEVNKMPHDEPLERLERARELVE